MKNNAKWTQVRSKILAETKADVKAEKPIKATDFTLCTNGNTEGYFMRYTKLDYNADSGSPRAEYRWICFDTEGVRTDCDPIFQSVKDENSFYGAMKTIEDFKALNDLK